MLLPLLFKIMKACLVTWQVKRWPEVSKLLKGCEWCWTSYWCPARLPSSRTRHPDATFRRNLLASSPVLPSRAVYWYTLKMERAGSPRIMVHIYQFTCILFYLATRITLRSCRIVWHEAAECSPLFQFPSSRGPRVLVPCIAGNNKLLSMLMGKLCCAREHSVQFSCSFFTQLNCTV